MAADDSGFQFDFSADEEQLLIQLATEAEAKDSVASAIDALPARSDFVRHVSKEDGGASISAGISVASDEASAAAATLLLAAGGQVHSPTCMPSFQHPLLPTYTVEN